MARSPISAVGCLNILAPLCTFRHMITDQYQLYGKSPVYHRRICSSKLPRNTYLKRCSISTKRTSTINNVAFHCFTALNIAWGQCCKTSYKEIQWNNTAYFFKYMHSIPTRVPVYSITESSAETYETYSQLVWKLFTICLWGWFCNTIETLQVIHGKR